MFSLLDILGPAGRCPEIVAAVSALASSSDDTERGAVYTRPEVVKAILDLSGYVSSRPLHKLRFLEPSFGSGEFLLAGVDRLVESFCQSGLPLRDICAHLSDAVQAVELHQECFKATADKLRARLISHGVDPEDAASLCQRWLVCDDFLLCEQIGAFDVIVGNPPYVRQERIPGALLREYRSRFQTMFDRADLYIAFYERALDLLAPGGTLGFICANRWLKNRYGAPLRKKIVSRFALRYYIDLGGIAAFHADVIAYPAITIINRPADRVTSNGPFTRIADSAALKDVSDLTRLVQSLLDEGLVSTPGQSGEVHELSLFGSDDSPWLLEDLHLLNLVRRLETQFPVLEQTGCKVGIGVATGCDRVYIGDLAELPVEESRKLPLVMARDLVDGVIKWGGSGVVNPFLDEGGLVDLEDFPMLSSYFYQHFPAIAHRHVSIKNPGAWYRTIDRIYPGLVTKPKLLVPDIKGEAAFVLDEGKYYPHHNLYYITSTHWSLRALQTVLRSSVTVLLVSTYCTRMSGGFLRFQAQYLRRIRLPLWKDVPEDLRSELEEVAMSTEQMIVDDPVFRLYGLSPEEAIQTRLAAAAAQVTLKRRRGKK